jgi:hypothetical protein
MARRAVRRYRHIANSLCVVQARFSKKETEMPKKKKRIRRTWTKDDLRLLKSMARDKQGVTKIAKALKRSPGATSVMAAKRGVSLSMRG